MRGAKSFLNGFYMYSSRRKGDFLTFTKNQAFREGPALDEDGPRAGLERDAIVFRVWDVRTRGLVTHNIARPRFLPLLPCSWSSPIWQPVRKHPSRQTGRRKVGWEWLLARRMQPSKMLFPGQLRLVASSTALQWYLPMSPS